jgi:Recombinase zinc beta ribbon domain
MLTGVIFCGHCGGRMHGQTVKRKSGKLYFLYRCYNGVVLKTCKFKWVSGPAIEANVKSSLGLNHPPSEKAREQLVADFRAALEWDGIARARQLERLKKARAAHEQTRLSMTREFVRLRSTPQPMSDDLYHELVAAEESAIKTIDIEVEVIARVGSDDKALEGLWAIIDRTPFPPDTTAGWRAITTELVKRVEVLGREQVRVVLKWPELMVGALPSSEAFDEAMIAKLSGTYEL